MDTIFALASAHGKAGVSVVRVSGPDAFNSLDHLVGRRPAVRQASLCNLTTLDGVFLDQALVVSFEAPHSFTSENIVEFQIHGSISIINTLLLNLGKIPHFRLAEPGEFTRRALDHGKLNMVEVEGLADLIDAETEAQRKQALRVLSGELGQKTDEWRTKLIRAAALLEATIDFADEDVPVDVTPEVSELLRSVLSDLKSEIDGSFAAERIRLGFEVAIVGEPNAGKSSLLNALAKREAAITSDIAGTTRDIIEVRMDLDGLPVTFLDTAGLRDTEDEIEKIGISRALSRAGGSDLTIVLTPDGTLPNGYTVRASDIVVRSKVDLQSNVIGISSETGEGISDLIASIKRHLNAVSSSAGLAIRYRHRQAMERSVAQIETALNSLSDGIEVSDLIAEDIRVAVRCLDALIGKVDAENLLDEIFSSFCLGK
jgi:tRNA modification GTPase